MPASSAPTTGAQLQLTARAIYIADERLRAGAGADPRPAAPPRHRARAPARQRPPRRCCTRARWRRVSAAPRGVRAVPRPWRLGSDRPNRDCGRARRGAHVTSMDAERPIGADSLEAVASLARTRCSLSTTRASTSSSGTSSSRCSGRCSPAPCPKWPAWSSATSTSHRRASRSAATCTTFSRSARTGSR